MQTDSGKRSRGIFSCTFQQSSSNLNPRLHHLRCRRSTILTFYSDHCEKKRREEGRLWNSLHILQQIPPSARLWCNLSFSRGLVCPPARTSTQHLTLWPSSLLVFKLPERFRRRHTPVSVWRRTGGEKTDVTALHRTKV